jgi:hypothetical protein
MSGRFGNTTSLNVVVATVFDYPEYFHFNIDNNSGNMKGATFSDIQLWETTSTRPLLWKGNLWKKLTAQHNERKANPREVSLTFEPEEKTEEQPFATRCSSSLCSSLVYNAAGND